jgi:hypothetical protein
MGQKEFCILDKEISVINQQLYQKMEETTIYIFQIQQYPLMDGVTGADLQNDLNNPSIRE